MVVYFANMRDDASGLSDQGEVTWLPKIVNHLV